MTQNQSLLSQEIAQELAPQEYTEVMFAPLSQEVIDAQFASIVSQIQEDFDHLPQQEQEEIVNTPFMYKRDGIIDIFHKRQGK